jgi:hypothetical protein
VLDLRFWVVVDWRLERSRRRRADFCFVIKHREQLIDGDNRSAQNLEVGEVGGPEAHGAVVGERAFMQRVEPAAERAKRVCLFELLLKKIAFAGSIR